MYMRHAIGAAIALLLAGSAAAQEGDKAVPKLTVVLATATQGGGFPLYGNAFAEVMMQADPSLVIETRNTMGSSENIPALEQNKFDLGLVAGESFNQAREGVGGRPPIQLKILTAIYGTAGMFAVRGDSPYHSIQDLVGKRVAFGAKGSGIPILGRYMLDGIALKQDEDFKSFLLDHAKEGPEMVLDGRADAIWGAGIGYPGFFDLAKGPSGVRFIAPTTEEIARMRAKHAFLKPMTIPAGSYPGQTAPINSLGSWSFILTRIDMPDDVAYRLARTLHGAEGAFCKKLAQACETTAANTVAAVPDIALIHPGVMKYFREIGVVK
jgi:TRAP transporter TAXI family solute receptor